MFTLNIFFVVFVVPNYLFHNIELPMNLILKIYHIFNKERMGDCEL